MGYDDVWKVLEEVVIELRKKGSKIPLNVMSDFKAAKILIKIQEAAESDLGENAIKIEQYLGSLEAHLLTIAQKKFPRSSIDAWLKRIEKANCSICQTCAIKSEKEKSENKFIAGVPRDEKWVRIKPLPNLSAEKLKQIAEKTNLSFREEQDGLIIIHGNRENIREFVKKMTIQVTKNK